MYPLHKFVPLPFGTYMMYIDHNKKRVNVETIPEDIKQFKKNVIHVPSKKPEDPKSRSSKTQPEKQARHRSNGKTADLKQDPIEPSYRMRYLLHNSQVITEQPPHVTLVDNVTGASIRSSAQWVKNRPKPWRDVVKLHQIENPEMTCTVSKRAPSNLNVGSKLPAIPEAEQTPQKIVEAPSVPARVLTQQRLGRNMQPHLHPPIRHSREQPLIDAREHAAKKRRRKVNKVMQMVSDKARSAIVKSSLTNDETLTTATGTKTSMRLAGLEPAVSMSSISMKPTPRADEPLGSEWRKSNKEMKTLDPVPFEAKDWNPRAEQTALNQIIVERMSNAVPYQWKEKNLSIGQRGIGNPAFFVL